MRSPPQTVPGPKIAPQAQIGYPNGYRTSSSQANLFKTTSGQHEYSVTLQQQQKDQAPEPLFSVPEQTVCFALERFPQQEPHIPVATRQYI